MNWTTTIPFFKARTPKQIASVSWADRELILNEDVNLFCWKRPVNYLVTDTLNKYIEEDVKPIEFFTTTEELPANLSRFRANWDPEHRANADAFWIDIYRLVSDFLTISDQESGNVQIKVIKDNACTKFHTDGYSLRLFTTYLGKGTEWLPEGATNRKGLGKSNDLIVKDPTEIRRMEPFEVGILKGELPTQSASVKGIVHRSPEICQMNGKRLILKVDF